MGKIELDRKDVDYKFDEYEKFKLETPEGYKYRLVIDLEDDGHPPCEVRLYQEGKFETPVATFHLGEKPSVTDDT